MGFSTVVLCDKSGQYDSVTDVLYDCRFLEDVQFFHSTDGLEEWMSAHLPDVAIAMAPPDSSDWADGVQELRTMRPDIPVLLLALDNEHMEKAFSLHVDSYLKTPLSSDQVRSEMDALEQKGVLRGEPDKLLNIHCFGNFEVFRMDGKPLHFTMAKCRELLAYLVNKRGASVTMAELAAALWENRTGDTKTMALLRRVISDLRKDLRTCGAEGILSKQRNSIAILVDRIECDYYEWDGNIENGPFLGEYMAQYSWAEYTTGALCRKAGLL